MAISKHRKSQKAKVLAVYALLVANRLEAGQNSKGFYPQPKSNPKTTFYGGPRLTRKEKKAAKWVRTMTALQNRLEGL